MKLYQANLSPFTARVRILIYAKDAPVELVMPPSALSSPEYLAKNPLGKIPTLEVDGQTLPESEVINEYLEERFPEPPLLPRDPWQRARSRLLSRFVDLYLAEAHHALLAQLQKRDTDTLKGINADLSKRFDQLEGLLGQGPYALGDQLTLADCALVPTLFFLNRISPALGGPRPSDGRPKLAAYWTAVKQHPAVARVYTELQQALPGRSGRPAS